MPSRVYTNADASRQYGRGRQTIGPWVRTSPLLRAEDPYEGLPSGRASIDDILGDAKRTLRDTGLGRLRRNIEIGDEVARNRRYDELASDSPGYLSSLVTSVFSPEQRESTARAIEGDSRNRTGTRARLRSFLAGAVGGAGEDSPWSGAMGEVTPLNVATGFGVTRTTPITSAIRRARAAQRVRTHSTPRSWQQGTEELGDMSYPAESAAPVGMPQPGQERTALGRLRSWLRGSDRAQGLSTREALDPATWEGVSTPPPVRGGRAVSPVRSEPARMSTQQALDPDTWGDIESPGRLVRRQGEVPSRPPAAPPLGRLRRDAAPEPTLEQVLIDALERTRVPDRPLRSTMGVAAEPVPRSGVASAAESRARQAAQGRRLGRLSVPREADIPPDIAPQTPTQAAGQAIDDPRRLLPAFGETTETAPSGLTRGDQSAIPGRKTFLRPEARTIDLANEYVQRELGPGSRVTRLKNYIRPTGDDELARALRQRAHIADSSRAVRQRFDPESGQIDPAVVMALARTGGGALAGSANPELVGADPDARVEGGVKGALLGTLLPDLARGAGRILRAAPQGFRPLGRQIIDEIQNLRYMGALSGRAIPKSAEGNVAAPFWAAAEHGTTRPIREFFSPQTIRSWFREFRNPTPAAQTMEQQGAPNIFGRILGAGDVATTEALVRAGRTPEEAARYLLRTPTQKLGFTGQVDRLLKSRGGKAALLFQTTPLNQAVHGGSAAFGVNPPPGVSPNRLRALAALSAAAGLGQSTLTEADPLDIAMTAPLFSVYSVPYLAGAATGKIARGGAGMAREIARGISPAPELGIDVIDPRRFVRPITRPAINTYFPEKRRQRRTQSRQRRQARERE